MLSCTSRPSFGRLSVYTIQSPSEETTHKTENKWNFFTVKTFYIESLPAIGEFMKILNYLFTSICLVALSAHCLAAGSNSLKDHPSPYLAMHGNDPVHWQSWDKKVFERARKENKLVFVSIGYFACHWCHVMQRESYQNADIAKMLNRDFIPVKVDRELQPALDARLIEFVERTRGYAGWPLNVFITPEGYPLLGLVYLPPKDFNELLLNIQQAWVADRPGMKVMAEAAAMVNDKTDRSAGPDLDMRQIEAYRKAYMTLAMQQADHFQGGFGEGNKFPLVPQLTLLLDLYRETKDKSLRDFLILTLDKMALQGMNDQLRGGFYRYVVDPGWKIPHFEKMLYDNAQLVSLYVEAAELLGKSEYQIIATQTVDFMLKELSEPAGGLISSLSAIDNKNVEGGYYLWSDQELKALLTPAELELMTLHWGMQHAPSLEDGHHAQIAMSVDELAKEMNKPVAVIKQSIATAKTKLLKRQQRRILPRDDKLLAAWNGLALDALTRAGRYNKAYMKKAQVLRDFIVQRLWDGQSLKRAIADDQYLGNATLEDYSYVAAGLLAWAKHTGKKEDISLVAAVVGQAWKRFYNEQGWLLSEDMIAGISSREAIIADGPMPSASATLIRVTLALARIKNDEPMLAQARSALNRGHNTLKTDNFWYATHILAMTEALALSGDKK